MTREHKLALGAVSDTGGDTWKRDSDVCFVQTLSFVVQVEGEKSWHYYYGFKLTVSNN